MISEIVLTLFTLGHAIAGDPACENSVPAHSTAGVHFVVAFPYLALSYDEDIKHGGEIHITSYEKAAEVNIFIPKSLFAASHSYKHVQWSMKSFSTKTCEAHSHLSLPFVVSGIYASTFIKSSSPVSVLAFISVQGNITDQPINIADAFVVMPEGSCYTSYHLSTITGFPSVMVFAFQPTLIMATFPDYFNINDVSTECGQSNGTVCEPEVRINLPRHRVWLFQIHSPNATFQHTIITSNKPIFVVAGNTLFMSNTTNQTSIRYSSMKPTAAWGREYYLPNLDHTKRHVKFMVNTKIWPIKITIFDLAGRRFTLKLSKFTLAFDFYLRDDRSYICRADTRFAMYLLVSRSEEDGSDNSLLNIIPTEQWMSNAYYVNNEKMSRYYDEQSFYLVIRTKKESVDIPEDLEFNQTDWKLACQTQDWNYFTSNVDLRSQTIQLFRVGSGDKVMLYIQGAASDEETVFAFPSDHYQGDIDILWCDETSPIANDGVDNDCDGFVDEEIENKKDDDGDGFADEDFASQQRFSLSPEKMYSPEYENSKVNNCQRQDKSGKRKLDVYKFEYHYDIDLDEEEYEHLDNEGRNDSDSNTEEATISSIKVSSKSSTMSPFDIAYIALLVVIIILKELYDDSYDIKNNK